MSDILNMKPEDLAAHMRTALLTPSGKILLAYLQRHCFMDADPNVNPRKWESPEQVVARYSRMTLFLDIKNIMQLPTEEKTS